jgi:hypothetical protein
MTAVLFFEYNGAHETAPNHPPFFDFAPQGGPFVKTANWSHAGPKQFSIPFGFGSGK